MPSSRGSAVCVAALLWLCPTLPLAVAQSPATADSNGRLLQELSHARSEIDARLTRAYATARLRTLTDEGSTAEIQEKEVQIFYDAPKYRVHVLHRPEVASPAALADAELNAAEAVAEAPPRLTDQLVIFDGETVYTIETGADQVQGAVYFAFKQQAVLRSTGYAYLPPLHLWAEALEPGKLDSQKLQRQDLASGGMVLTESNRNYIKKVYLFGDFQYDLRRVALFSPDYALPFREHNLYWDRLGDVWFLSRYVVKERYSNDNGFEVAEGQVRLRQQEVEFTSFVTDEPIDADVFRLTSLRLPRGTMFADHRSNLNGQPKRLVWDGAALVPETP